MANYPLSDRKFTWAFAFIWICWVGVHAWLLNSLAGITWALALIDCFCLNVLLCICCLAMTFKLAFYRPWHDTYFFSFIVTLALAGIWVCCSQWLLQVMVTDSEDYLLFVRQSWPLRF